MWGFKFRWGSKLVCQDRLQTRRLCGGSNSDGVANLRVETGSKREGYVVVSNALVSF